MIECKYYLNYKGPNLKKAQLWKKGEEKKDITDEIKIFYGKNNNWNGKLYQYSEVFPGKDSSYLFYIEFMDENNRKHWFHGMVGESKQNFNPPLAMPFNQNN